jgi:hypothetical protein
VSLSSAMVQSILSTDLPKHIKGPAAREIIARIRQDTESIRHLPDHERQAAVAVYSKALKAVFWVNVILAAVGVVALWAIKEEVMPEGKEQGRRDDLAGSDEESG